MKWTSYSFYASSAEEILSFTSTILVLIVLRPCVFMIFRSFRSLWDISSETDGILYGNKDLSKAHMQSAPSNTQKICTHLCVSSCRSNVRSPVPSTHRGTQLQPGGKAPPKAKHYRDPPLLFTRWSWLQLNESVGWAVAGCCNKAPFRR